MALYAFDGTGNEDREGTLKDSNVLLFFNAYEDPLKTQEPTGNGRSVYLKGIGTRAKEFVGKALAEQFGIGGLRLASKLLHQSRLATPGLANHK